MRVKFTENFSEVIEELGDEAEQALENAQRELQLAALEIERDAKKNAPVDTGMLRASITSTGEGNEYEVGTNVEYAQFVEYGTRYQSAQPFLIPAFEKVIKTLGQKIEKAIKRAMK